MKLKKALLRKRALSDETSGKDTRRCWSSSSQASCCSHSDHSSRNYQRTRDYHQTYAFFAPLPLFHRRFTNVSLLYLNRRQSFIKPDTRARREQVVSSLLFDCASVRNRSNRTLSPLQKKENW